MTGHALVDVVVAAHVRAGPVASCGCRRRASSVVAVVDVHVRVALAVCLAHLAVRQHLVARDHRRERVGVRALARGDGLQAVAAARARVLRRVVIEIRVVAPASGVVRAVHGPTAHPVGLDGQVVCAASRGRGRAGGKGEVVGRQGARAGEVEGVDSSAVLAGVDDEAVAPDRQIPFRKVEASVVRARALRLAGRVPRLRVEAHRRGVLLARVEVPERIVHRVHLAVPHLALCEVCRALCGDPVLARLLRLVAFAGVRGGLVAAPRPLAIHGVDRLELGLQRALARDDVVGGVLAHHDVQRVARACVIPRGPAKVQSVLAGRRDVEHVLQPGHGEAALAVDIMVGTPIIWQHLHV
mmetsp:Transcript_20923/g.53179  ORF Transcript_20923/g.53179 Transcript_20923/m.53179 type:complete len:355 (+) Transcript_20923:102-1166(+)